MFACSPPTGQRCIAPIPVNSLNADWLNQKVNNHSSVHIKRKRCQILQMAMMKQSPLA